jgi:hypothetical protein
MGSVHRSHAINVVGCATTKPDRHSRSPRIACSCPQSATAPERVRRAAKATLAGRTLMASRFGYKTPKSSISKGKAPKEAQAMPAEIVAAVRRPATQVVIRRQLNGQKTEARIMLVMFTATGTSVAVVAAT